MFILILLFCIIIYYNLDSIRDWCAFNYIKDIRKQILIQPDIDLLNELLQLYKIYCYREYYSKEYYSNILPYIIISIESLCYILSLELSDPEIDNVLNTLVMDSEYIIQNGMLIENDKNIVTNHVTRNTYYIVSKLLLYFNKSKIANSSDLALLVMKLLPPELQKDAKIQKQSVFQTYLNLMLNKYKEEDIFQIAIPTTRYLNPDYIPLPTLMITDLVGILYQDVEQYINATKMSQIERFLFLPLQLKLHFGFPKKKSIDKIYKKTKFKIASLQEFWTDLGYLDLHLTKERLKQMFEIYYCMGYMNIYSNNKIALMYQSQYNIDSLLFLETNFLLGFSQIASLLIDKLAKLENVKLTVLNYIKDKFNLSEVQLEYIAHGMLLPYQQLEFNKELYDEALIIEYIHFISYIQQDFKTNKEKYISIYKSLGYKNIDNFASICFDQELLANKFKCFHQIEPAIVSNPKFTLDLDKVQTLQESTKIAQSLLHSRLGEESILDLDKVQTLQESTKIAQSLLHNRLGEEEESIDEEFEPIHTNQNNYSIDITEIFNKLITKEFWDKKELMELFKSTGIMLNAGIEKINEYSDEQYDDILIIDNNTNYEINKDILEEHFNV